MYKLQVWSGIGDCLRMINSSRIVARCIKENTKCCINYKILKDETWCHNNKKTFQHLISSASLFEYIDEPAFNDSYGVDAKLDEKKLIQEAILPIPVKLENTTLPEEFDRDKIHIAVHLSGSTYGVKYFSLEQLYTIFEKFQNAKFNFHIIDWAGEKYLKNKQLFAKFDNVFCWDFQFNEYYKLITLCDLLVCPDSYSKYVAQAAGKKIVVACTKSQHIPDVKKMLDYFLPEMQSNPKIEIVGWVSDSELVDSVYDIPIGDIISSMQKLLAV